MTIFSDRRARYQLGSLQSHSTVGLLCFVELHRRIHGNNFGRVPGALKDAAFGAGGYCLDAHELLPAGSVADDSILGADGPEHFPSPTHIERENP